MDSVAGHKKGNESEVVVVSDDSSNESTDDSISSIDDIINDITNKPKVKPKRQIAVYIDEDVAKAFDRYTGVGRNQRKGARSELIEKLLRPALTKMGYLK